MRVGHEAHAHAQPAFQRHDLVQGVAVPGQQRLRVVQVDMGLDTQHALEQLVDQRAFGKHAEVAAVRPRLDHRAQLGGGGHQSAQHAAQVGLGHRRAQAHQIGLDHGPGQPFDGGIAMLGAVHGHRPGRLVRQNV